MTQPPSQAELFGNAQPAQVEPSTALMLDRVKEVIWKHEHARDRSQQRVPGPSQLGTDCERSLAYTHLGMTPVNHTQDHWQAYLGTAAHAMLADAFTLADNNSGRYLIEHKVHITSPDGKIVVPGSLDVYDRKTGEVIDFKFPGARSRQKYARSGPPNGYRIQAHVYAHGLAQRGEQPQRVGNVYFPAEGRLTEAFAWSEPYDPRIAEAALERYQRIANALDGGSPIGSIPKTPSALCGWCNYYMPNSPDSANGCQGAQGEL